MSSKIGIIIPTRGDRKSIEKTIESLDRQEYVNDFEVLIVSDKKIDVYNLAKGKMRLIIHPGKPGEKRNVAAATCNADILAFIDDDAFAEKDWLFNILDFFENNPDIHVIGGPNLTPPNSSVKEKASGYIFASFLGAAQMSARYSLKKSLKNCDERSLTACNLAVRKETFLKAGGFPEDIFPGEEVIMLHKLRYSGYKLYFNPKMIVYHLRRPLFMPHIKQVFGYGRCKGVMMKKYGFRVGLFSILPAMATIYLFVTPLIGLFFNLPEIITAYCLTIISMLLIFFVEATRIALFNREYIVLPYLSIGFILHHISYGLGVLIGLAKNKNNASHIEVPYYQEHVSRKDKADTALYF
jgi:GT2 family glycosyltransferase